MEHLRDAVREQVEDRDAALVRRVPGVDEGLGLREVEVLVEAQHELNLALHLLHNERTAQGTLGERLREHQ